jgi:hypothetical protein
MEWGSDLSSYAGVHRREVDQYICHLVFVQIMGRLHDLNE